MIFDDFQDFIHDHYNELSKIGWMSCEHCVNYHICVKNKKSLTINWINRMVENRSRYPDWVIRFLQSQKWILNAIPGSIYVRVTGMHEVPQMGCQYNARDVIDHLDQVKKVYDLLSDDESKKSYLGVLMYRLTMDESYVNLIKSKETEYFIKAFADSPEKVKEEVYVDCGAFTGDTFIQYCQLIGAPKAAFLIEPDSRNRQRMEEAISSYSDKTTIHIVKEGIYKDTRDLYFSGGRNMYCFVSEVPSMNAKPLRVVSIDDLIDGRVDFIKMDIQGSEKNAVLGAERHIREYKPKLAICLYHAIQHLWEIPLLIHNFCPKYKNYVIKHHSDSLVDTILYVW